MSGSRSVSMRAAPAPVYACVLTGEIRHRALEKNTPWLSPLKKVLRQEAKRQGAWQVYRGDHFQLEIKDAASAFHTALLLKATTRKVRDTDVRLAIGIGSKSTAKPVIAESDGQVFSFSEDTLDHLKKAKRNLGIQSPWPAFDREMNVCFQLALVAMDAWTQRSAELCLIMLTHPGLTQKKLSQRLRIAQSSVSERLRRARIHELLALDQMFREKVSGLSEQQ